MEYNWTIQDVSEFDRSNEWKLNVANDLGEISVTIKLKIAEGGFLALEKALKLMCGTHI